MAYWNFILRHRRLLGFGFILTLFSSFGQTYFMGLFNAEIRASFALSNAGFGTVYSVATLVSGIVIIWAGRMIDHVDLRLYTLLVCGGLGVACLLMSFATSVVVLCLAIFLLRFFGQGLMFHTASTALVRLIERDRGKALSLAFQGMSVGEATFPIMVVFPMQWFGWQGAWLGFGVAMLIVVAPASLWMLKGQVTDHQETTSQNDTDAPVTRIVEWSRRDVLRDPRFYLMLPTFLSPSYIITGLFFHQAHISQAKGWSLALMASGFTVFAIAKVMSSLVVGPLIDRWGATRHLPFFLLPVIVALLAISWFEAPITVAVFMGALGISVGWGMTVGTPVWVEIYGTAHIGAIRAMVSSLGIIASAASPVIMGWMLDAGLGVSALAYSSIGLIAASTVLAMIALRLNRAILKRANG